MAKLDLQTVALAGSLFCAGLLGAQHSTERHIASAKAADAAVQSTVGEVSDGLQRCTEGPEVEQAACLAKLNATLGEDK
ncbi:hypothetical protein JKY72_03965 [Candidatus Gracilibacteria bacterium]|nr:hypothetical protein [Candidatus Gracilibacteria bacterium]